METWKLLMTLLVMPPVALNFLGWLRRRRWVCNLHQKAVLITGCDSGFGYAAAKSLYTRGVYVYAGCYTEAGAEKLRQETGARLKTLILDVTNSKSIQDALQYVKDTLPEDIELWGIVNNAGMLGQLGPIEFTNNEDFNDLFRVNVQGMIDVTRTFLPLVKKSKGRVINTCSISSLIPCPNVIACCTTKWAALGFSETLRVEKSIWGIKVSAIAPAGFKTNITNIDNVARSYRQRWEQLDPEIRAQYGENYVTAAIDNILAVREKMCNADLSPVIRAYEHALFSVHPRNVYYPGGEILRFLPLPILLRLFNMNKLLPIAVYNDE